MNKYVHAMRHGLTSLTGWFGLRRAQPEFARELFKRRWRFFVRREFVPGFATPDGFIINMPDALISY